jgi:ATP-dependent protease ClpP protease subunit
MSQKYHGFKKDDIDKFIDYDIYLPTRTIYMGSISSDESGNEIGVDHILAERCLKTLHILDTQAPAGDKPITIIMNNYGGDVRHGMAIYDAIKDCKNHVTIKVYGGAMSMGSIILQAADRRIMSQNSRLMIHYGIHGHVDHAKITSKWQKEADRFDRFMEDLYLQKMEGKSLTLKDYLTAIGKEDDIPSGNGKNKQINITRKQLEKMLNFDTIMSPKMALQLNLIDEIIE